MIKSSKIILIGLPGSGKSTFGQALAMVLKAPFIDLDNYIEEKLKKTISTIFQEEGEGKFRELETYYLKEVLELYADFVLSTGGGTPCFNDNIELINRYGTSVFLDTPIQEINSRLQSAEVSKRPMFSNLEEAEITLKLKSLSVERFPFYKKAKIILSGEDISIEHFLAHWLHKK
jgi:shikimate kinase